MESRTQLNYIFEFLISIDLLKQRHIKKQERFYCSTFRGHHDSIIKILVKQHANKERYKIGINYNKHLGTDEIRLLVQRWLTPANV